MLPRNAGLSDSCTSDRCSFFCSFFYVSTHREIISESGEIRPNVDCNYRFPMDLPPNGFPIAVLNQSENGNYNPNSVWIKKIQKIFLRVHFSVVRRPAS